MMHRDSSAVSASQVCACLRLRAVCPRGDAALSVSPRCSSRSMPAAVLGLGPYRGFMAYADSMLVRYLALARNPFTRKEELMPPAQEKCLSPRLAVQCLPLAVAVQEGCLCFFMQPAVQTHLTRFDTCVAGFLRLVFFMVVPKKGQGLAKAKRVAPT